MSSDNTQVVKTFMDNNLYEEFHTSEGMKNGLYSRYYNGILLEESNYKDNKKDGDSILWDFYGNKTIHDRYKDGLKHGVCMQWGYNGILINLSTYKFGLLDGEHKQWFGNGDKWIEDYYTNGVVEGDHFHHVSKNVVYHIYFMNGTSRLIPIKKYNALMKFKNHLRKRCRRKIVKTVENDPILITDVMWEVASYII